MLVTLYEKRTDRLRKRPKMLSNANRDRHLEGFSELVYIAPGYTLEQIADEIRAIIDRANRNGYQTI
jgi:hypothetical protein